ncbi:MAG: transglycosylase SLT domain-containing protein [Chloroflexi bacterium]|nr:transglycosylase SLT domain-containing protein [Chloroflexota bacterium]MDA1145495.1 transglycosylase SLT domain-containing protein [Chloroflexota bacterium]
MAIDSISGTSEPRSSEAVSARPAGSPAIDQFAAVLTRHLDRPRSEIASVRAEIAALRGGGALFAPAGSELPITSSGGRQSRDVAALAAKYATGDVDDPYGWRAMARDTAEQVIGPGYGWLFERQIGQESGFSPDVVFGERVSTAGAEGIAQLMPQYYPSVDRANPEAGLKAGAETMRHYLTAWDGDVRKALASYNAGLGRVRSLVEAHGDQWEQALPAETKDYLNAILGSDVPRYDPVAPSEVAVFGGRGPGGVLSTPVQATSTSSGPTWLDYFANGGSEVRAPSAAQVVSVDRIGGFHSVLLDHGNGWRTSLFGLGEVGLAAGDTVQRGELLGTLPGAAEQNAQLRLGISYEGRSLDPRRYVLPL